MNTKLEVLIGEESKRIFDYRVVVTNPNAISEIEKNKKNALLQSLQQIIEDTSQSEDEFNSRLEELNQYYTYEWQDFREIRANALTNHYVKELRLNQKFNELLFNQEGKFLHYIISYSNHTPFTNKKGVCKMLYNLDNEQILLDNPEAEIEEIEMTEEECVRRQAQETDYMMQLLLEQLEEKKNGADMG